MKPQEQRHRESQIAHSEIVAEVTKANRGATSMMSDVFHSLQDPHRSSERRLHPRRWIPFVHITFEEENHGTVLDISEGGVAVHTVAGLMPTHFSQMRLQFESRDWVEVSGRIVWTTESKKVAGVQFVELDEETRDRIQKWIASAISFKELHEESLSVQNANQTTRAQTVWEPTNATPTHESQVSCDAFQNQDRNATDSATLFSHESQYNLELMGDAPLSSFRRTSKRAALSVLGALLLSTLVFAHLERIGNDRQSSEVATAVVPESPSNISENSEVQRFGPQLPLATPGFVLQAGAMAQKKNADALAESLQRSMFPAFVFRLGAGRLYRVVVGPYSDVSSALKVKKQLEQQGIETIRAKWIPTP
jgi:hypothetical protein